MNLQHGPKIRSLTSTESLASLESWRNNVLYGLRLNPDFRPYLRENYKFGRKTKGKPCRDLTDEKETATIRNAATDREEVVERVVKTKEDKAVEVDILLDQIANYASTVPRNDITKESDSLAEVWKKIRQFYNKQQTGSSLNDVWNVRREADETPQALFGRMKQMYDDNLLTPDGINHIDGAVTEEEELTPTLHNTIILHWMQTLHPELRDLVTEIYHPTP